MMYLTKRRFLHYLIPINDKKQGKFKLSVDKFNYFIILFLNCRASIDVGFFVLIFNVLVAIVDDGILT